MLKKLNIGNNNIIKRKNKKNNTRIVIDDCVKIYDLKRDKNNDKLTY